MTVTARVMSTCLCVWFVPSLLLFFIVMLCVVSMGNKLWILKSWLRFAVVRFWWYPVFLWIKVFFCTLSFVCLSTSVSTCLLFSSLLCLFLFRYIQLSLHFSIQSLFHRMSSPPFNNSQDGNVSPPFVLFAPSFVSTNHLVCTIHCLLYSICVLFVVMSSLKRW